MDDETFLSNNGKKFGGDTISYHTFFLTDTLLRRGQRDSALKASPDGGLQAHAANSGAAGQSAQN